MKNKLKKLLNSSDRNGIIVIKNSFFSMAGSILGQLIALLSSLVMGRLLGVKGLGSYTFAITFAGIVYIFLNMGIGAIFQRNIAQDRNSAEINYSNALSLRLFFSIPGSICLAILASFFMRQPNIVWLLILACLYTGFTGILTLIESGINAIEKFQITFIFTITQKMLCFLMAFLSLYFTRNILIMLLLYNLVMIFLVIIELVYVNKNICKIHLQLDYSFCKSLLRESYPTILGSAAEYLSLKSDALVLNLYLGEVATGLYSVSSNIYIAASFIPLAMAKAATPTFNRMIVKEQNVKALVKKTFYMMISSAVIIIIGVFFIGKWGIVFLWGKEFEPSSVSLKILSISLLFMPANRFLEYMLVGLKKQVYVAKCIMIGAVFNMITNLLLIPIIGINAVAITTVITEFIVMVMELLLFNKLKERIPSIVRNDFQVYGR